MSNETKTETVAHAIAVVAFVAPPALRLLGYLAGLGVLVWLVSR